MNIQGMNPLMAAPQQAQSATSNSTSGTGSSGSTTDPNSASSLESTFMSLLATELQNQDPTQPVDPTQMVGEMISLNQLDQLININQTLSGLSGTPSTSSSSTSAQTVGSTASAGTGSNTNLILQGAYSNAGSLIGPTTLKTIPGANGSHLHLAPTTPPVRFNISPPASPGTVSTGELPPAALMNLYGNIGAPANATNRFYTVGGR
jgi:flagellar basal-body rod modification protein FlgD